MVVKPDLDKVIRATCDALTGILYADDAQIVDTSARKHYGSPERVEISMVVL
jgi:crossover junction endodeoxyribonuclease RusA